MSKGGGKVSETEYEKELAKVYAEQWAYYEDKIVPVENKVIADANSANDASVYEKIGSDTNLSYQKAFDKKNSLTIADMEAKGVNPNSGKFKGEISKLSDMEASSASDAKSRAQSGGQERYVDKMGNVVAMGQGESQSAVASLNDLAVNSQRKSFTDARIDQQSYDNNIGAIGAISGALTSNSLYSGAGSDSSADILAGIPTNEKYKDTVVG